MSGRRPVRIGVIGNAALDASGQLGGGARIAALIQEAGAETAMVGLIGNGPTGASIIAQLQTAGVDVSRLTVSAMPAITLGDQIDVAGLFAMDAVLIAVSDVKLHRFLVNLPVHTAPNARLIGLLPHLAAKPGAEALEIALLHDLVIATASEIQALTQAEDASHAIDKIQRRMIGSNLRTAAISDCDNQAWIVTKTERFTGPISDFEAFVVSACTVFAARDPWPDVFNQVQRS